MKACARRLVVSIRRPSNASVAGLRIPPKYHQPLGFSTEVVVFSGNDMELTVGEPARALNDAAGRLLPVALNAIPVHGAFLFIGG